MNVCTNNNVRFMCLLCNLSSALRTFITYILYVAVNDDHGGRWHYVMPVLYVLSFTSKTQTILQNHLVHWICIFVQVHFTKEFTLNKNNEGIRISVVMSRSSPIFIHTIIFPSFSANTE